jgi:hypothetical protein
LAADPAAWADAGRRAGDTWWESPVLDSTLTTLAPPAEVWSVLGVADRLYYRVEASAVPHDEPFEATGVSAADDGTPWTEIRSLRARRDPVGGTRVLDPDEQRWRGPQL